MMRSRASEKSWPWTACSPRRAAARAASLTRLARSAPDHARGVCGDPLEVDVGGQGHLAGVHGKDRRAALLVGRVDDDAPVEAARAQQGGIEDLGTVGGGHHDDAFLAGEAVHLGEDLVQGLLALVVTAHGAARRARAADGVELVDEDDGRGRVLGLLEEVTHAARADAHEHLDKLRGTQPEEGHLGLAGHGPGEQRLAGAGLSGEQHAARDAGAELAVALGTAQEVDDLGELLLGLVDAGHI